jgi:arylsulfatase A-like enzyme
MAKTGKPNIIILWGDDIGWWNISYNRQHLVLRPGFETPG